MAKKPDSVWDNFEPRAPDTTVWIDRSESLPTGKVDGIGVA